MNVWKELYVERLLKEEKLLEILSKEYDRIGKSERLKPVRKRKVKEIKAQCEIVRTLNREYRERLKKEGIE